MDAQPSQQPVEVKVEHGLLAFASELDIQRRPWVEVTNQIREYGLVVHDAVRATSGYDAIPSSVSIVHIDHFGVWILFHNLSEGQRLRKLRVVLANDGPFATERDRPFQAFDVGQLERLRTMIGVPQGGPCLKHGGVLHHVRVYRLDIVIRYLVYHLMVKPFKVGSAVVTLLKID